MITFYLEPISHQAQFGVQLHKTLKHAARALKGGALYPHF